MENKSIRRHKSLAVNHGQVLILKSYIKTDLNYLNQLQCLWNTLDLDTFTAKINLSRCSWEGLY